MSGGNGSGEMSGQRPRDFPEVKFFWEMFDEIFRGGNFKGIFLWGRNFGGNVRGKCLDAHARLQVATRVAILICAAVVNTHTHRQRQIHVAFDKIHYY